MNSMWLLEEEYEAYIQKRKGSNTKKKGKYEVYPVPVCHDPLNGTVTVPGSKSMTNRALLMAALSKERSILHGVLFSDDSRHFLACLQTLGFQMEINEKERMVAIQGCGGSIPQKTGTIHVGSAGTAARFLTAMLALSDGEYVIECSEQMKRRPMSELFRILTEIGAEFSYLGTEGYLPVKVKGNHGVCRAISLDISRSTQFLSAMLMTAPMTDTGMHISITSSKKDGAYIRITRRMLDQFGVHTEFDGNAYHVPAGQKPVPGEYTIEPDVSAACYFYAMAALTGGSITVRHVYASSMQGDMKFLDVLKKMGCRVEEKPEGICVTGPQKGQLQGVDVDMNDFSDQALTLAAMAPFARTSTMIRNIGHIRGQECNRMAAIVNELSACGVRCEESEQNLQIFPGTVKGTLIQTYEDHRVAMAFSLLGLMAEGILIDDPGCCSKTFEDYFEVLERLLAENGRTETDNACMRSVMLI